VQALALQRAGVIPERLLLFSHDRGDFLRQFAEKFSMKMSGEIDVADRMKLVTSPEVRETAERALTEYEYNLRGVCEAYGK
jgi:hypothetical protein